jgi:uncharacterized protein (TIGR02231 family)
MKRAISFILISIVISSIVYAADEIVTKPNLSSVKIFLRGAELYQTAKVKLEKGMNEVVLTGIASNVDRNSINVSGKGDGIIISVVQRFDYLRSPEKHPEVKALEDSLEFLNKKLSMKQNDSDVLKYELDMILANKNIGNEKIGVSVTELQKMAEFYRKKISEIKSQLLEFTDQMKKTQKDIDKVTKQLNELNNQFNRPTNEVAISVSTKSSGIFEFTLSYLVYDAGWQPNYNIRAEKINSSIQLNYIANVWQNSGFDWNDSEIILSTRNPNRNNTKPELYAWNLNFYEPVVRMDKKAGALKAFSVSQEDVMNQAAPTASMADYFVANETQLAVEFTPSLKYSIPSDSKPHSVAIKDYSLKAEYEYFAVPKMDNNAFLVALLKEWSEFNLLPGEANIYFENSYVGKTYLNPASTKDTLQISLGRDENVLVTREAVKDFTEDKFLSSDIERIFAFNVKIKNNKKSTVKLTIEDQIPISQNEDITIKIMELSGAKYNQEDGKLKWKVEVEAGKSIEKKLVFSVRYPKDKIIPNL